jgi:hypothetical protein
MSREKYHEALLNLPITVAETPVLPPIFPHISLEKALETLVKSRFVACPPTLAEDSFLVVQLRYTTMTPQSTRSCSKLMLAGVKRLGAVKDMSVSSILPAELPFWRESLLYASVHWPSKLVNPTAWNHLLELRLQNLQTQRVERRLILVLRQDYADIERSRDAPRSRMIDANIQDIFDDPIEIIEVLAGGKPFCLYMCALCGAGIDGLRCDNCEGGQQPQSITKLPPIPVPPKVCAQLWLSGHKFAKDPSDAQAREHLVWRRAFRVR